VPSPECYLGSMSRTATAALFFSAGLTGLASTQPPLLSPWNADSVPAADVAYQCPAPALPPRDFATNSYYIDPRHSITDPVLKKKYEESVAGIDAFSRSVAAASDRYRTTGSNAAAQCVADLLTAAARQKALAGKMDGFQASYVQGWALGAWAVAWLKIRGSRAVSREQAGAIMPFLKKLAEANREYYETRRRGRRPNDADNNHLYWAAFAIAAAGIAANDRSLFEWSVAAYRHGIEDIRPDGTLPMEMARGQMALHYHLYALPPLVMLAEFGAANGLDLYAERDFAIRRLVQRCVAGLESPAFFERQTGIPQVVTQEIEAWQISWGQPWTRHFPEAKITELLGRARWLSYTSLGGLPPP